MRFKKNGDYIKMRIINCFDSFLISLIQNKNIKDLTNSISRENEEKIKKEFSNIIANLDFTNTLTDIGISSEKSFIGELTFRVNSQIFPPMYPKTDLRSYLQKNISGHDIAGLILNLSNDNLVHTFKWLTNKNSYIQTILMSKINQPLKVLLARLIYYSSSWQIKSRLISNNKFIEFYNEIETCLNTFLSQPNTVNYESLCKSLELATLATDYIRSNKKSEGISFDITYRLIKINDIVKRMKEISFLVLQTNCNKRPLAAAIITKNILTSLKFNNNLLTFLFNYIELVFYEITEHTSSAGEKYIKKDKKGFRSMLIKGLIGGSVVGLFALLKPLVKEFDWVPAAHFLSYSIIYSGIFLLIYFLKGSLATKQPAMTASRIARKMDESKSSNLFLEEISSLIRDTFRTQFIAIIGNFILAMPVAGFCYYLLAKYNIFSLNNMTATYLIDSLAPFSSLSFFYAFLTGLCLALSGLLAGAVRNWYIFNHINERLIHASKQKKTICKKIVLYLDKHLDGLSSNISLGFLLGFLSVIGNVVGLPIDVRHITFASAQVGIGLSHNLDIFEWNTLLILIFSVLMIGLINLLVSFSTTFFIVFRSRKLTFNQGKNLLKLCLTNFIKNPLSYFTSYGLK